MPRVDAAVILAGGRGERAWPLTATRPKPLLPLPGNDTILSRLVRQARRISRTVVVLAPPGKRSLVEKTVGSDVDVVEQDYSKGYGTGAAALAVLERLGSAQTALLLYGDLVIHDSVFGRIAGLPEGYYILAFRTKNDGRRFGVIVEKNGVLEKILEKPGWGGEVLANAGVYILPVGKLIRALEEVGVSERGELELTDAVNRLAEKVEIRVVSVEEEAVIDTGTWWDYLKASRRVLEWIVEEGACKPLKLDNAYLYDAIVCGYKPRVKPPVSIEGLVWIGENVELGPFTRLRSHTILLGGVELGAFVEVKGSILFEGVKAHHHAYIGDSVIGEHSNIAAGTVFANLRHDGQPVRSCAKGVMHNTGLRKLGAVLGAYVKTGVNTSILPGSRIGPCTWIEPGSTVKGDVPACSFYRSSGEIAELEPRTPDIKRCCESIEYGKGAGLCLRGG